jgi:integrase
LASAAVFNRSDQANASVARVFAAPFQPRDNGPQTADLRFVVRESSLSLVDPFSQVGVMHAVTLSQRLRRNQQESPAKNRPWTINECRTVLAEIPDQLKLPVALAMFTGLRKGDVLALTKDAIREGKIYRRTNKTRHELSLPIHPDLMTLLDKSPRHDAITLAATTNGTPWTESGFNSSLSRR